ncbi:hypothetical protein KC717_02200 [Candidatus Dojkabacteria bacterium]|uniref:Uncharacterized protein n=1 Tax=Candidatus Dojkabacteria bacterium TaxID=2099670 RepID=A0A955L8B8_9BACT|nr:hypothetical protein [Candidatus Dojkabacteria bacterium]
MKKFKNFLPKLKQFLKPSVLKIVIFLLIIGYTLYILLVKSPWGHFNSPAPAYLLAPFIFEGKAIFIPLIINSYLVSCFFALVIKLAKRHKWVIILIIFGLIFLTGIDEPVINNTVNKTNYTCSVDSDCVVESTQHGFCGKFECVNEDWRYYNSVANRVLALSCAPQVKHCSCVQSQCVTHDVRESTNLDDCENFTGYQKEQCEKIITDNIKYATR